MDRRYILFLAFGLFMGVAYPQNQIYPQYVENIKYDKSGNIKYIRFDGETKTAGWESPSSSDSFWKEILVHTPDNLTTLRRSKLTTSELVF